MRQKILSTRLTRRDAMRLLGAGAAGLAAACRGQVEPASPDSTIIRTILRDVTPDELGDGAILMHEHLSVSTPYPYETPPADEVPPHFTVDVALITDEVRIAGSEGVSCIVDGGHDDMGRSLDALRTIAKGSGVHIVASGGFDTQRAYPPDIAAKTVEQITDELVEETRAEGYGAYGEIGTSGEMTPDERKVLTAVARAHVRTGLPIFTHNAYSGNLEQTPVPPEAALRQLDLLEAEGVDLTHLVIGHLCCLDQPSAEVAIAVAERGGFVGFDRVNWDPMLEDEKRVAMVLKLVEAGHADKLVLASDFYRPTELTSNGGPGFAKTVTVFAPMLLEAGLDEETVRQFTTSNPRRWLAFQPRSG